MWLIIYIPFMLFVFCSLYFIVYFIWHSNKTKGDRFFSMPVKQRQEFAQSLKKHAFILIPFIRLLSAIKSLKRLPYFEYKGVRCPYTISSEDIFFKAEHYPASKEDIFIATQMKCGTTWMQQIVFEILHHGDGNLNDDGYRHMYALSPWIETSPKASVSMEKAPLVSHYKKRIIKTHLPVHLCPYTESAKYIYVARNPVSCFASCKDFLEFLSGPFCPKTNDLMDWFCSDEMWWCSWPNHVADWWDKSLASDNILFISFEELKDNPRLAISKIAVFLAVILTEEELLKVIEKSSFNYMQDNEIQFEMSPPSIFSVATEEFRFMQSGKKHRQDRVSIENQKRIIDFCKKGLTGRDYVYPYE